MKALVAESSRNESAPTAVPRGYGFGAAPVFFAAISTILGAILFLRFGYAVGHVGLAGVLGIILLGHMVTIPTALAIAEIATNRKVEGGGEYFIISRSFGTTIGTVIGLSLYISQAISVAFYMIAFGEAFRALAPWVERTLHISFDPRLISLPASLGGVVMALTKGATLGIKALYAVVATLGLSLLFFFAGSPLPGFDPASVRLTDTIAGPDPFSLVFAICFPAFTGMTAGVGLSGDLRDPKKSIPAGTLLATFAGMVTYGALCAISFLEHFAARPSYRPAFRSRWYISLLGALMCLFLMFQMDPLFALVALLTIVSLYQWISRIGGERDDLAAMFEGVMTQLSRHIRIRLQLRREERGLTEWRPGARAC